MPKIPFVDTMEKRVLSCSLPFNNTVYWKPVRLPRENF
jgi:hypothetical protein